jgi:ketosteroid isomerase-like protein
MSQQNVEIVRRGLEYFLANGEPLEEILGPDFVWDMSTFRDVLGVQESYEGVEGVRLFIREWTEAFEEWELEVEEYHDAGEKVVAVCRQRGRSALGGVPVEMLFAQVYTLRDGLEIRMEMYADPAEALKAVGLTD